MMPTVPSFISLLTEHGVMGLVIAAQFWYIVRLDRKNDATMALLREESASRVKDAKAYTDMALEIHERVTKALSHLGDLLGSEQNGASNYHIEED